MSEIDGWKECFQVALALGSEAASERDELRKEVKRLRAVLEEAIDVAQSAEWYIYARKWRDALGEKGDA